MKAPILPTPPSEPEAPRQSWPSTCSVSISMSDDDSLQSVLDAILKWGTKEWRDEKGYSCRATGPVSTKDITFEIERDDNYDRVSAFWKQPYICTMSDAQYATAAKRYNDFTLPAYRLKLAEYEMCKAQYAKDLVAYEEYKEQKQREKDLSELARLQKKLLGKTTV